MQQHVVISLGGGVGILVEDHHRPRCSFDQKAIGTAICTNWGEGCVICCTNARGTEHHGPGGVALDRLKVLGQGPPAGLLPLWHDDEESCVAWVFGKIRQSLVEGSINELLLEHRVGIVVSPSPVVNPG